MLEAIGQWPPGSLAFMLAGAAVAAIAGAWLAWTHWRGPRYVAQASLFSRAERQFLLVLEAAVGDGYRIYAKVRMADLLRPAGKAGGKRWWRAFTKISSKHVDYVVVDRQQLQVLAAVELDDKSHDRGDRQARDAFVNKAFAQAGIRLVRVPVRHSYDTAKIRAQVLGRP